MADGTLLHTKMSARSCTATVLLDLVQHRLAPRPRVRVVEPEPQHAIRLGQDLALDLAAFHGDPDFLRDDALLGRTVRGLELDREVHVVGLDLGAEKGSHRPYFILKNRLLGVGALLRRPQHLLQAATGTGTEKDKHI